MVADLTEDLYPRSKLVSYASPDVAAEGIAARRCQNLLPWDKSIHAVAPPDQERITDTAGNECGSGQFARPVVPPTTSDSIEAHPPVGGYGNDGIERNRVYPGTGIRNLKIVNYVLFDRKGVPHELCIQAEVPVQIPPAPDDKVRSVVGKIGACTLRESDTAANRGIPTRKLLPQPDARTERCA